MKKSIIALMGLFTLVACSEDAYQEADKMSENGTVENTEPQNSVKTIDPAIGYFSKYDISSLGLPNSPLHELINNTSTLSYTVTAYLGLAYDDGNPSSPMYYGRDLSNGDYPNFYMGSNKYGNVVATNPLDVSMSTTLTGQWGSVPVLPKTIPPGLYEFNYTLSSIADPNEIKLMNEYGKVYYYFIEVNNGTTPVTSFWLNSGFIPNIGTFAGMPGNWNLVGFDAMFSRELISEAGSREIVVTENMSAGDFPSAHSFVYSGVTYTMTSTTDPNGVYLELN